MLQLVDFARPPVVETVLSVGFAPIDGLTGAHIGEFWSILREGFPNIDEQPPYDMPMERLADGPPGFHLSISRMPQSRYWLISEDDSQLIQIQRDWFAFNWRYRDGKPYKTARYQMRRAGFVEYWERFREYVDSNKLGAFEPKACEVTYINHVRASREGPEDLGDILQFVSRPRLSQNLGRIESWDTSLSAALLHDRKPIGRLHMSARLLTHLEEPVWQINLTARGKPLGKGLDGILQFLDTGHEAIVINFKEITTDEKHSEWGLQ